MPRIALLVFTALWAAGLQASVIKVPQDQPTIQAGINAAGTGDTVLVAPGTYVENINFMGKAITVTSSDGPKVTIVDGNAAAPVAAFVKSETTSSVLSGFTLQNGVGTFDFQYMGGGVSINNASPTIKGNVIQTSSAGYGGGISVYFGSPIITGNTVQLNSASFGGGISILGASNAKVLHNTVMRNTAGAGAGFGLNGAGSALIQGNKVINNGPAGQGGGFWIVNEADEVIVQNLIARNTAGSGCQVYSLIPQSTTGFALINNTIVSAPHGGADAAVIADGFNTNVVIENNIISALGDKAAIVCNPIYTDGPPIIQFNDGFNPGVSYGGMCTGFDGTNGNISGNPTFVNGASGNYQLGGGSPAINTGSNSAPHIPVKDFAGHTRIVGGTIDMGAYEVQ